MLSLSFPFAVHFVSFLLIQSSVSVLFVFSARRRHSCPDAAATPVNARAHLFVGRASATTKGATRLNELLASEVERFTIYLSVKQYTVRLVQHVPAGDDHLCVMALSCAFSACLHACKES